MSTSTAAMSAMEVTLDTDNLATPETDSNPLEARWGVQLSQRFVLMNAFECGISHVPFGKLFPIKSFRTKRENHTIDDTKEKELLTLIPAAECEGLLMEVLGGAGAQNQTNWGLKTGFRDERDAAKMAVISRVLLPTLREIREIQAELGGNVIDEVCPGTDDLDFGERNECTSCWWNWLNSAVCTQHMENMAMVGMPVNEKNPTTGEIIQRHIKPTMTEFRAAHVLVYESCRQALRQLEIVWKDIAGEYEASDGKTGRKGFNEVDQSYRKDLHQTKPQEKQFQMAQQIAKGMSAGAGSNNQLLERLVESQIQSTESQKQTNELLRQLTTQGSSVYRTDDGRGLVDMRSKAITASEADSTPRVEEITIASGIDLQAPAKTKTKEK